MSEAPDFVAPAQAPLFQGNAVIAPVSYGSDRDLIVEFFTEDRYQTFESNKEGRAIYKPINMIRMRQAGDRLRDFVREVLMQDTAQMPSDLHRFPRQWAAFQSQQEQIPEGTPLEFCKFIPSHRVKELKACGIHTAEQMANVSDGILQGLGLGADRERALCKSYLTADEKDKVVQAQSQLIAKNKHLENELEALKAQMAMLSQNMQHVQPGERYRTPEEVNQVVPPAVGLDAPKRGPGRPRKGEDHGV